MQTLATILIAIAGLCVAASAFSLLIYFWKVRPELEGRRDSEAEAARAKVWEALRFLIGSTVVLIAGILLRGWAAGR